MAMTIYMWATFAIIAVSMLLYITERYSIESTSLGTIASYLILFSIPVAAHSDMESGYLPTPQQVLGGFANTALITIMALLVLGQGLFHTDALNRPARWISDLFGVRRSGLGIALILCGGGALSAFLNNTPVVVMLLPLVGALAQGSGTPVSRVMIPLSYISILGGMTTLIGSSTNLLVADVARSQGVSIEFFTQSPLGLLFAIVGAFYCLLFLPRLMPEREANSEADNPASGRQFISEVDIVPSHPWVGRKSNAGMFPSLKNMTVRLVRRGSSTILPPFEDITLSAGDTVVLAATRQALTDALSAGRTSTPIKESEDAPATAPNWLAISEAVVAPASRLIGRTVLQSGVQPTTGFSVVGIQRRSRMPRAAMTEIRLEAGDVLLVAGRQDQLGQLRANRDLLLTDGSTADVPIHAKAPLAILVFLAVVAVAAFQIVPIVVAALAGAAMMIAGGCLNVRQAARAFDSKIYMLVGASLASATALQATGGADFLAGQLSSVLIGHPPVLVLGAVFALIALATNFLSNHATAVLFTPIALALAPLTGIDPMLMVLSVIMAANCSFATPIGYQTNLLVMGPGRYRFSDYLVAGVPLILLLWATFILYVVFWSGV